MTSSAVENVLQLRAEYDAAPDAEKGDKALAWLNAESDLSNEEYLEYVREWQKGQGRG